MGIAVGVATLSDPELLNACLRSIFAQSVIPSVYVVVNSDRVREAGEAWAEEGATVCFGLTNLGTSASWNLMMRAAFDEGYSGLLILNDDVQLVDADILERLSALVDDTPRTLYSLQGLGFSGICITRDVTNEVGFFDEGFWPAYFEDNDFHRRVWLAGIPAFDMPAKTTHVGSASLRKWREWEIWNAHYAFAINGRRFEEKWGGATFAPKFTQPWNGQPDLAWSAKEFLKEVAPPPPWLKTW